MHFSSLPIITTIHATKKHMFSNFYFLWPLSPLRERWGETLMLGRHGRIYWWLNFFLCTLDCPADPIFGTVLALGRTYWHRQCVLGRVAIKLVAILRTKLLSFSINLTKKKISSLVTLPTAAPFLLLRIFLFFFHFHELAWPIGGAGVACQKGS